MIQDIQFDSHNLSDDKFDSMLVEMIAAKFNHHSATELERKPKADKGV